MLVDLAKAELQNIVRVGDQLRTRKALVQHKTPTAGTGYVGGFTIESPNTSEPWHYLFEQSTTTGAVTLRVYTEEFVELFSYALGALQANPAISVAVQNMQGMINSPAFSAPLYFLVGGGLLTAVRTVSQNSIDLSQTVLDIPTGHIATFGDRFAIAQANAIYVNDPEIDPRTFVAENATSLPGSIYDVFQGRDGALYMCTTAGIYTMSSDALGQGQNALGFISRIPNLETMRPRNACAAGNGAAVLQKDAVAIVAGGDVVRRIDLSPYDGRRYLSHPVEVDDLRLSGELFPTASGFIVGFRGARGHFVTVDLANDSVSYTTADDYPLNLVGTLRSRNGETLYVLSDGVAQAAIGGPSDHGGSGVLGTACLRLDITTGDDPVVRHVTVGAANHGSDVTVFLAGAAKTKTAPTKTGDTVIGTALWSTSASHAGRTTRTARLSFAKRATEPHLEVTITGGDIRVQREVNVELEGNGRAQADRQ